MARKARGELRIAVLGDSFMEGYSVGDDDHFSRRLEINLVENGTATEVLNFGVGGYSPLQSYLAFKTEASQYRPDIVLLGMFLENDLREMKPESKKLAAGAWGLKSDARPYLKDSDPNNFATFQWNYAQAVRNYESNLAQRNQRFELVKLVQRAYLRTQEPTVAETPLSAEESCKDYEESWLLTEKVLSKLRDDTAAVEARLVVFSVPGPALKYIDTGCPAQRVPERLASVLGRLHIPYVDLFPLFEHETNERGEAATFSNTDHHWNETGHLLAAQAVGEALRVRHNVRSYR
jgi:lysophospholipase L1-like esterase